MTPIPPSRNPLGLIRRWTFDVGCSIPHSPISPVILSDWKERRISLASFLHHLHALFSPIPQSPIPNRLAIISIPKEPAFTNIIEYGWFLHWRHKQRILTTFASKPGMCHFTGRSGREDRRRKTVDRGQPYGVRRHVAANAHRRRGASPLDVRCSIPQGCKWTTNCLLRFCKRIGEALWDVVKSFAYSRF